MNRSPLILSAALTAALLAGCVLPQSDSPASEETPASAAEPSASAAASAAGSASTPAPTERPRRANVAGRARTFATATATYTSVGFESLPGWRQDDLSQTWPAFLSSCRVLNQRGGSWNQICERARQIDGKDSLAIRAFFEREFSVYQIRDDDRRPDGVVTGYFEPEIAGSRKYKPPYIYPVYGQPEDMLYLDTRKLPPGTGVVAAQVQGREVSVLSGPNAGAQGTYTLDLSQVSRNTLDRKMRLRIEGRRLLPYYTRQEIETRGAPNSRVLAFVNSANALYEMQIQGSGRIRLPDGAILRLGYAEQNGYAFRPMLASNAKVRTRGGAIELEADDDDDESNDITAVRVRGFRLSLPASNGPVAVPGRRIAGAAGSGITDPSYVFFREIPANLDGPIGALGVPLKPGRSIAVDPRSTPLGYPVFVASRLPSSGERMQRLTIAQDTGGAIRGALRADYFFGNGRQAAQQARRMKQRGQLWVLLPRGLLIASAGPGAIRTRGGAAGDALPQCLIPDDASCVGD